MTTASDKRIVEIEAKTGSLNGIAMRAGRAWPVGSPVQIEVVDADEDPPEIALPGHDKVWVDGVSRPKTQPDPTRIGRLSLAALKADARFTVIE